MDFKEQFPKKWLPVCKQRCSKPDIKLVHYEQANQYRLYCKECGKVGQALPQEELTKSEMDNADVLEPQRN